MGFLNLVPFQLLRTNSCEPRRRGFGEGTRTAHRVIKLERHSILRTSECLPVRLGPYAVVARPPGERSGRYSYRNATIGSTFIARRAGIKPARNVQVESTTTTAARIFGS